MSANLHDQDFYSWTQQQAGLLLAGKETDIDERKFPATCPYSLDQILDLGFYPGDPL